MKNKLFIALKKSNQVVDLVDGVGVKGKTVNDLIESIAAKGDKVTNFVLNKIKESPKETWKTLKQAFAKHNS